MRSQRQASQTFCRGSNCFCGETVFAARIDLRFQIEWDSGQQYDNISISETLSMSHREYFAQTSDCDRMYAIECQSRTNSFKSETFITYLFQLFLLLLRQLFYRFLLLYFDWFLFRPKFKFVPRVRMLPQILRRPLDDILQKCKCVKFVKKINARLGFATEHFTLTTVY